jgi:UDP-N-acetylmuramate--alanine ligase
LVDNVCVVDIYPAREEPIQGVTSALIYDNLKPGVRRQQCRKEEIPSIAQEGDFDVLVTLGAGDIENYVSEIKEILQPLS